MRDLGSSSASEQGLCLVVNRAVLDRDDSCLLRSVLLICFQGQVGAACVQVPELTQADRGRGRSNRIPEKNPHWRYKGKGGIEVLSLAVLIACVVIQIH